MMALAIFKTFISLFSPYLSIKNVSIISLDWMNEWKD